MPSKSSKKKSYILVAEDDKAYANIYRVKLTNEGFDVLVVGDGDAAIASMKQKRPDLVLLDLIMPCKDGFETLERIKADPKLKGIKVVIFSNLGQEEDIERARRLGALDYFVKAGLSIHEMVDKVRVHLL